MPGMRPVTCPAALSLLAAALAACGESNPSRPRADASTCDPIGCAAAYQVDFARTAWPSGTYRITVNADGVTDTCEVELPLVCGRNATCTATAAWSPILSGCALAPAQQSISGITFNSENPMMVEVSVFQADRPIAMGRFTPTYTSTEPGGPGCGMCKTGKDSLALAP
jgi:hypothetical protein